MNNIFLNLYIKFQILVDREDGQDMVEYALLVALIAVVCIVAATLLGSNASAKFSSVASAIS